jgi:Flp pilus assembly protein TadD
MGLKRFGDAIAAYEACRQRYQSAASQKFQNIQDADRMRQTDLDQIRIAINALSSQTEQPSQATQNQIRQLRDLAQRIQLKRDALNNNLSITSEAPAFVLVALGSAYFRSERMADAEREYKAALDQDTKAGEAWNNLAVVYLMTGRYDEAQQSLKAAEKAGYKVNPNLKDDITKKRAGG